MRVIILRTQETNASILLVSVSNLHYGEVGLNAYFNSDPLTPSTDGQIDFVVTQDSFGNTSRHIRWYGLPRNTDTFNDTATQPIIQGWNAGAGGLTAAQMTDVDFRQGCNAVARYCAVLLQRR